MNLSKDDIIDIAKICYHNSEAAAKIFFPEHFYREFDSGHKQIFDLLDNSNNPFKVIKGPRGTGKTSIIQKLYASMKICYLESRFVVPVGSGQKSSELQSENLKTEFMTNQRLRTVFNIQKTKNFSKTQWIANLANNVDTMVWPKGAGQRVRGMMFGSYRPDLVLIDDLENDENIRSEEQRKYLKDWFYGPLMGIVDRGRKDYEFVYIDTLKHEDSLLQSLLDDSGWDSVELDLCTDDYETNFPNYISTVEVREMASRYRNNHELDVFFREFRGIPTATENAPFTQELFQYYNDAPPDFNNKGRFTTAIVIDPAKTANLKNAETAIVGGSIDMSEGDIYYRDIVNGHYHPNEMYDELGYMIRRIKPEVVAVEVTGINEFIIYPIKTFLYKHFPGVAFAELHARGGKGEPGKITRIKGLAPFYRQGAIYHNRICSGALEAQLMSFPRSKRWDVMDAAAYFVELFEQGSKYAARNQDSIDEISKVLDEFTELGYTESDKDPLIMRGIV